MSRKLKNPIPLSTQFLINRLLLIKIVPEIELGLAHLHKHNPSLSPCLNQLNLSLISSQARVNKLDLSMS